MRKYIFRTIVLFSFVFSVSANETHDFLVSKNETERATIFHQLIIKSGFHCDNVKEQYFQGIYKNIALWVMYCADGNRWSVRLPEKLDQEVNIKSCDYYGIENYTCIDNFPGKFNDSAPIHAGEEDHCRYSPHIPSKDSTHIIDRCGIVKIVLNNGFEDHTKRYLELTNKFHPKRDPGVVSLLQLVTNGNTHTCKARLFRYLPTEQGYMYNIQNLTDAVALFYASTETSDYTNELLNKGLDAPIRIGGQTDTHELVRSKPVKINSYTGWETVVDLWDSNESDFFTKGNRHYSLLIKYPEGLRKRNNKYYLAIDCNYFNKKSRLSSGDYWVEQLYKDITILK